MTILDQLTAEFPDLDLDDFRSPEILAEIERLMLETEELFHRWRNMGFKIQQERQLRALPVN